MLLRVLVGLRIRGEDYEVAMAGREEREIGMSTILSLEFVAPLTKFPDATNYFIFGTQSSLPGR